MKSLLRENNQKPGQFALSALQRYVRLQLYGVAVSQHDYFAVADDSIWLHLKTRWKFNIAVAELWRKSGRCRQVMRRHGRFSDNCISGSWLYTVSLSPVTEEIVLDNNKNSNRSLTRSFYNRQNIECEVLAILGIVCKLGYFEMDNDIDLKLDYNFFWNK